MNDFRPVRKNTRLPDYDYRLPGSYFITICTKDRYPLLGNVIDISGAVPFTKPSDIGIVIEQSIRQIPVLHPGVSIDSYCIMPDHVHMIVTLPHQYENPSVPHIIGRFKSYTDHLFRIKFGFNLWQRNFFDHIIRNQEDYNAIAEYIKNNPTSWAEKQRSIPF